MPALRRRILAIVAIVGASVAAALIFEVVLSLAITLMVFVYPYRKRRAAGDLSRNQADIGSCLHCHKPFRGPIRARCVTCHSDQDFEQRASPATAVLHRDMVGQQIACSACHTEHRGALAQITEVARVNPHGEFIFLATGANSCSACHEFAARIAEPPRLKTNSLVAALRAAGGKAHVPGKMALCLKCHTAGRNSKTDRLMEIPK